MTTPDSPVTLDDLVDPTAAFERLGSGYALTEGPTWHPAGYLLYSEIPSSSRYRWDPTGGARRVTHPTNRANGSALAPDGSLVVCEHETSVIARLTLDADGAVTDRQVVASHVGGNELNSPNDVVVRSDGTIFFTDPTYGRLQEWVGRVRPLELDVSGVYSVRTGDAEPRLLVTDFTQPNGLCFSPDESVLYVNDSEEFRVRRFEVLPDGRLADVGTVIDGLGHQESRDDGICDGMKCDKDGNIWVTGPGGIWVVSPRGERLGILRTPEQVHNLAWGMTDFDWVFATGSNSVHRIRTMTRGAAAPDIVR